MRRDSNSQRPSLQASLPLHCLFAPISPQPNYLVVWSTWLLQCDCCQLLDWLKELVTGAAVPRVEVPAATAENGSSAAVRNKGTVTVQARSLISCFICGLCRWFRSHFHGDGFCHWWSLNMLQWVCILRMQEGDTACRCQGACNYRKLTSKSSFDHVRILFSRFYENRPIGNRTLGYISISVASMNPRPR